MIIGGRRKQLSFQKIYMHTVPIGARKMHALDAMIVIRIHKCEQQVLGVAYLQKEHV